MNHVSVSFTPCSPAPSNGYQVLWRVKNTTGGYIDAGSFTSSPAVFDDGTNPDGTQYEGMIRSNCGTFFGNPSYWSTIIDNSSCGAFFSDQWADYTYHKYDYPLHVEGSSSVFVIWEVVTRPNKFSVYTNTNTLIYTTGWKGIAPYPGPWGGSLNTVDTNGSFTFTPILGVQYILSVEVGNALSSSPYNKSDNFMVNIACV